MKSTTWDDAMMADVLGAYCSQNSVACLTFRRGRILPQREIATRLMGHNLMMLGYIQRLQLRTGGEGTQDTNARCGAPAIPSDLASAAKSFLVSEVRTVRHLQEEPERPHEWT